MRKGDGEDMVKEVHSEERDAETPGASSHERKHGGAMPEHHKRERGGHVPKKHETKAEEHKEEEKKRHKRKAGGAVPGHKAKHHPGRRARGGATADMNPTTAAGHMSEPEYERPHPGPSGGGMGADNKGKNG